MTDPILSENNLMPPQECRFDGVMEMGGVALLQFTDLGKGPGYGATFYVELRTATSMRIAQALIAKRRAFRTTRAPLIPPLYQRAPRAFLQPDYNHSH